MNKLLSITLFLIVLIFSLVSCEHEHSFSNVYESDGWHHWKNCIDCDSTTLKENHKLDFNDVCEICGISVTPTEGVVYDISGDGTYAEVIGYTGTETKVRIADKYNDFPVKNIYTAAFNNNKTITHVYIPTGVTTISDKAFEGCSELNTVVMPDSVTNIGKYAFYSCKKLTSISIPRNITNIEEHTFARCENLASIVVPSSVMSIGEHAFDWCSNLTSVVISNGIVKIGSYAFYGCYRMESVVIPPSVQTIDSYAFDACTSLSSVTISENIASIGKGAFLNTRIAFSEFGNCEYLGVGENPYFALLNTTNDNFGSYDIHPDTQIIADGAFSYCDRLSNIVIPNGVKVVGIGAFSHCDNLISVTFPDSVSSISGWMFQNCHKLTTCVIPKTITNIGNGAFYGCSNLKSIIIPNSVREIGERAFYLSGLDDLYYEGDKQKWESLFDENTICIWAAEVHYNYTKKE